MAPRIESTRGENKPGSVGRPTGPKIIARRFRDALLAIAAHISHNQIEPTVVGEDA
jgi:hypothetical protein